MKHIYAGHLQGKRPTEKDEETRKYLTPIQKFWNRYAEFYRSREVKTFYTEQNKSRISVVRKSVSEEDEVTESFFEGQSPDTLRGLIEDEMFIGSMK